MAALHSLGVRKPAALSYLIAESILGEDCTERDYTWETYHDGHGDVVEEVVTTEHHVVWSRGGVVRKVFSFEVEQEKVIQALLTWFPTEERKAAAAGNPNLASETEALRTFLTQGTQPATDPNAPVGPAPFTVEVLSRALVVFLKSQAHVFFLSGTTHVVNLPFEVDRAFPAARGVVLQRKISPPQALPLSPQIPTVPPNSFLTNAQSFLSEQFSQSFLQPHRRNRSSLGPSRLSMGVKPGPAKPLFLEELVNTSAVQSTDGLPRLYSFTDPLSELGLVVNATTGNDRGGLLTTHGSSHRRLEAIDKAEEIIYVSSRNEMLFDRSGNDKPLLLVVTANFETNVFTIWSAAYLEPRPISNSRKHHASTSGHKPRRRSSYGPTAPGTGATTPALRGSERLRESLGGPMRGKTHQASFNASSQPKERLSDQAVEDVLASQLNPDFELARQPKESRRVSSLLSRAELSTSYDRSAFQDLATQRHSLGGSLSASFGASQRSRHSLGTDRTSFVGLSHTRNRASTPGSITSRMSLGGASIDDTFDEAMDDTFDTLEDYDELDDLFAPLEAGNEHENIEGLRKELVMSMVAEIPAQRYLKAGLFALNDPGSNLQVLTFPLLAILLYQFEKADY